MPGSSQRAQFAVSPAVTAVAAQHSAFQIQVAAGKEIVVKAIQNQIGTASQLAVEVRAATGVEISPVALAHSGAFAPAGYALASTMVKGRSAVAPNADSGRLAAVAEAPIALAMNLVVRAGQFFVVKNVTAITGLACLVVFEERSAAHEA